MEFSDESGSAGGPSTLVLHLLGRCNLKCLHCYMEGAPTRRELLPVDLVLGAIAECKKLDFGNVYITGGEPLLYRELQTVLRAATEINGLEVTLCTNAMLVSPRHVAMLRDARARVNVSVDGDEAFHDHFRQHPGAFRETEKGIRLLVEAGIPVTIVTTISQGNFHLLASIAEWASGVGAETFRVQPLLKLGRGIEIADQRLTIAQTNRLILELSDLANRYRTKGLKCSLIGVSRRFLLTHPCGAYVCNGAGCHRRVSKEIKKLVIREDGTILPEITNLSHQFSVGRIEDGPLSLLVNRYFEDGYHKFDQLCRSTYAEVLPTWESAVVPWDQIVAERSQNWRPRNEVEIPASGCGDSCSPAGLSCLQ